MLGRIATHKQIADKECPAYASYVKNWIKKHWWGVGVVFWVIFSDRVEPLKSHFWLAMAGAVAVGLLMAAIPVGINKVLR